MARLFPDLRPGAAVGAIRYWDASVDDARLVLTLVRTAASYGAHAASRTQVVRLTRDGDTVSGAVLVDLETGREITVHADHVINATGVWTESAEALVGADGGLRVLASKGVHVVVPRDRIRGDVGLILQTETSVLFVIPWSRYWVLGTTDTPWEHGLQHPVANAADIEYVLDHANEVLEHPLTPDDVIGTWAGLRPQLQPGTRAGTASAKVSREHTVATPTPGLTVVAGGKLTTYRVMAKDAVDFALGPRAGRSSTPPPTCAPRSTTPPPTRASCTWRTSCCCAPASSTSRTTRGSPHSTRSRTVVGDVLGWDATTRDRERTAYRERCTAEAAAAAERTDGDAERVRLRVEDVAPLRPLGASADGVTAIRDGDG